MVKVTSITKHDQQFATASFYCHGVQVRRQNRQMDSGETIGHGERTTPLFLKHSTYEALATKPDVHYSDVVWNHRAPCSESLTINTVLKSGRYKGKGEEQRTREHSKYKLSEFVTSGGKKKRELSVLLTTMRRGKRTGNRT